MDIRTGRPVTLASNGMVTSPHSLSTAAGLDVLRAGGSEFAWAGLMSSAMHISSSETWPLKAYVRVFHNGHWFYIDNADLISKQSFALMETAFALQAGEVPPITTILTLPISR